MKKPDLYYRDERIVIDIIGRVESGPRPWDDVVEELAHYNYTTVERTIRSLASFGAFRITGKYSPKRDTRVVEMTELGHAWLARELMPLIDDEVDWIDGEPHVADD